MRKLNIGEGVCLERGVQWEIDDNQYYTESVEYKGFRKILGMNSFVFSVYKKRKSESYRGGKDTENFFFNVSETKSSMDEHLFMNEHKIEVIGEPSEKSIEIIYLGKRAPIKHQWKTSSKKR